MEENKTVTQESLVDYNPGGQTAYTEYSAQPVAARKEKVKKERRLLKAIGIAVACGLCFGICGGFSFYGVTKLSGAFQAAKYQVENPVSPKYSNESVYKPSEDLTNKEVREASGTGVVVANDVSAVVDQVMPAMVSIINNATEYTNFWGQTYTREISSSGSGIIIGEKDGELLIVTNHHVANNADKLEITFINGSSAEANVKGMDSQMDLAVLAVDKNSMDSETLDAICIARLGDSDDLKLGKPVVVIGNALGYGQSVTSGIISGLNREITMEDGSTGNFIQTNAAINPGNSGGALLNIDGDVIGIVSSKSGGGIIEGMGYAIPISSASPIIADLMERRTQANALPEDQVGYMGVSLQTVGEDAKVYYGMPGGAFVFEVVEGLAADKAGIRPKDIIIKFDGEKINSNNDVISHMQYYAAGETVTVTVARQEDGQYVEHDIQVVLGNKPQD